MFLQFFYEKICFVIFSGKLYKDRKFALEIYIRINIFIYTNNYFIIQLTSGINNFTCKVGCKVKAKKKIFSINYIC